MHGFVESGSNSWQKGMSAGNSGESDQLQCLPVAGKNIPFCLHRVLSVADIRLDLG